MKELTEIEAYLLDEIDVRECLEKRSNKFDKITSIMDTVIMTSSFITAGVSIGSFQSGAGQPIDIALSRTSLRLPLATAILGKSSKMFTAKQEKHDAIKFLAQSKLDNIANIISQTLQGRDISSIEFHKVLQQLEKYRKLAANSKN